MAEPYRTCAIGLLLRRGLAALLLLAFAVAGGPPDSVLLPAGGTAAHAAAPGHLATLRDRAHLTVLSEHAAGLRAAALRKAERAAASGGPALPPPFAASFSERDRHAHGGASIAQVEDSSPAAPFDARAPPCCPV